MTARDTLKAAQIAVDTLLAKFKAEQPVTLTEVQQTRELIAEVYADLPLGKHHLISDSIGALDAIIAHRMAEIDDKHTKVA